MGKQEGREEKKRGREGREGKRFFSQATHLLSQLGFSRKQSMGQRLKSNILSGNLIEVPEMRYRKPAQARGFQEYVVELIG